MSDVVDHPQHYKFGEFEVIDIIEGCTQHLAGFQGYLQGNIIKYIFRWFRKNGTEDLKKAKWYIDKLISELELEERMAEDLKSEQEAEAAKAKESPNETKKEIEFFSY